MTPVEFFGKWSEVIPFSELSLALNAVERDMKSHKIVPSQNNTFNAFLKCPYDFLRVVFIGDCPYCLPNKATGLLFGTSKEDTSITEQVLFNAVDTYCSYDLPFNNIDSIFPTLEMWASQGVLLLNSALTTREGVENSHNAIWHNFTKSLVENLVERKKDVIFALLGEKTDYLEKVIPSDRLVKSHSPAYCYKHQIEFPNIFKQIDDYHLSKNIPLIYWI